MPRRLWTVIAVLLLNACSSTPPIKLPPPPKDVVARHILDWHREWIGTPHRFGGDSRAGMDCSAYVRRGYRDLFGIELPRTAKAQSRVGRPITERQVRAGDLLHFCPDTYPDHVGIALGDGTFVHVSSRRGVIRSRMDRGYWHKYFCGARRLVTPASTH